MCVGLFNRSVWSFVEPVTPQQQLPPLGIWVWVRSSFPREQVSKDNFSEYIQCGMFDCIRPKNVGFGVWDIVAYMPVHS